MSTNSRGIGSMSDRARTMNTEPSFLENERQLAADFARGVYDVGRAGFSGLTHQVVGGYGGIIEALIQQGDYDKAEWLINEIQQQAYLPEEGTAGAEALETIGKVFEPVEKHLIKKPGDFLAENVSPGAGAAYQGGMTSFLEFLPFHLRSRAGPGIGQVTPAAFLERPASKSGPTTAMGGPEIGQFVESPRSDTVPVRQEDIQYQTVADNLEARGEGLPVVAKRRVDPTVTERLGTTVPALTSAPEELPSETLQRQKKAGQKIACGDCFGWSFDTFAKAVGNNENVKLHRGKVLDRWGDTSAGKGNYYDHAWIEKDGRFYDWQTSVYSKAKADGWSKEDFEKYFQPKEVTVFGDDPEKDLGFLIRKEALYRPLTDSEIKEHKKFSAEPMWSPKALKDAANQTRGSREILIEMAPQDFLRMADDFKPVPFKKKRIADARNAGKQMDSVPTLGFDNMGKGRAKVAGHEGRHRALRAIEEGYDTIPVLLKSREGGDAQAIRWGSQEPNSPDYVDDFPTILEAQGEKTDTLPFPVRRNDGKIADVSKIFRFHPSGGIGIKEKPPKISFSDPDEMGFRSVAEDVMGLPSFPNKGTAKQMEAALGQGKTKSLPKPVMAQIGNRKIDKEELKFLGITDLLEEAKRTGEPVTKEQIQNAIESNRSNMYLEQEVLEELPDESILREMVDPHDPTKKRIEVIDNEGLGVGVFNELASIKPIEGSLLGSIFAIGTIKRSGYGDEDEYWDIIVDGEISGHVSNENEARVRLIQEASKKGIQTQGAKHRNEVAEDVGDEDSPVYTEGMGDISGIPENYREIKVRLPEEAGGDIGSHYGDDVAYHMRVSDRKYTQEDGRRENALYVDEIQSDYAQAGAGRKLFLEESDKKLLKDLDIDAETKNLALRRFDSPETKAAREELFESIERHKKQLSNRREWSDALEDKENYRELAQRIKKLGVFKQNLKEQPLVAGQEKWVQHAIKSLITRMVNEGKDRLIFTSGTNQAKFWGEKGLEKFYDVKLRNEVKDVLKGIDKDAFEMVDGASDYDSYDDIDEYGEVKVLKHISVKNTQKIRDFLEGIGDKPRGFGYSRGGEIKNFSRGTEVSSQDDRLYYDFMGRLGTSAEGAKDVLASEALKLTQPEESAKGVSKAQIFDRLGAISDYGYLGYDVLRHLGGKKDAFSADPEKRPLSSDWMAKQAGVPYLEEESAGRILGGLASWNLVPAIRGSVLGMVKKPPKPPKDERQGDLFDDPTPKPSEQGVGSFQGREEFTDFSTQPSKLGNQSLFPNERKQGRKLLVLGCCKTKTKQDFDIPARERYIGQLYQVLNKYDLENGLPDNVDIAVLSAKHGLIRLDTPLRNYDLRMEPKHRDAILENEDQVGRINNTFEGYDDVFVAAGKDYTKVIDNVTGRESYKTYKDIDKKVEGLGDHKRILGNWLAAEKGRSKGVGSLQKRAKEMNVKKMPGSFAEKIETIREKNKLQGSSESGSFSKKFAQDILDLTRKVNEHPYNTLDDFEKQAALMQQLKHKTSVQDLLSNVNDEAVREAAAEAIRSISNARYKDKSYKKLGTDRYFKPVNAEKVSDWVIVTKGKDPRLKIKFQELTERTTSREVEKPKPKFIDLDEMELSDHTPDAFAQGGGVSSLAHKAKTMNFKDGGASYKKAEDLIFSDGVIYDGEKPVPDAQKKDLMDEASLEYIKSLRNPKLRKYKFHRFLKKTPEERAQIIAQEKLGRTEFLMELMPYLRKDTKPEDIPPAAMTLLRDTQPVSSGFSREVDKYMAKMPFGTSGSVKTSLLNTEDVTGDGVVDYRDEPPTVNRPIERTRSSFGPLDGSYHVYSGLANVVASRADPSTVGHEYRHLLDQDLPHIAGSPRALLYLNVTEGRNRVIDLVTARTETEFVNSLGRVFGQVARNIRQAKGEDAYDDPNFEKFRKLRQQTNLIFGDLKKTDYIGGPSTVKHDPEFGLKKIGDEPAMIWGKLDSRIPLIEQAEYEKKLKQAKKDVFEEIPKIIYDVTTPQVYSKEYSENLKVSGKSAHRELITDILENYHQGPYFKKWYEITKNAPRNIKYDSTFGRSTAGQEKLDKFVDKLVEQDTFLPKPPSAFDELSSQRFMRRN
jgi:hypothetical protein